MNSVLLTDGENTNTLAAIRLLGKNGFSCYVLSKSKDCICAHSKYCTGSFVVGEPKCKNYIENLEKVLCKNHFDILLPIGFNSHKAIILEKERLEKYVRVPTVGYAQFEIAGEKDKTYRFAEEMGILVPKNFEITCKEDFKKVTEFPVVIKAVEECGSVEYAKNYDELVSKYKKVLQKFPLHNSIPIVQEYIPGDNGYGFFGLYWKGKLVSWYTHERIHMYPPNGGPSTFARTTRVDKVYRDGRNFLDALNWHGVAMVEFKRHEGNGKFYLIEVNPKYWGSLDLGIAADAEFPLYHIMLALNEKVAIKDAKYGVRFRWVDRDLKYAMAKRPKLVNVIKWFLLFFDPRIKNNISLSDFGPTLFLIKRAITSSGHS